MKILIVSDITNIKEKKISHYSLDKGLNLAKGLKFNGCDINYVVSIDSYEEDGILYINYLDLDYNSIDMYDYIIIVRECAIEALFNVFTELKKIFFEKKENRKSKIIIKSDSCAWIINKDFRKYISRELNINGSTNSIIKWVNNNIDIVCVQNNDFFDEGKKMGINESIMLISNMAVPYKIINYDDLENPFKSDYSYCKNSIRVLKSGDALLPNYYINNPDKINELLEKKRIKLIYIGRIKTDSGNIIYIMRDIINMLGDDYELHIFPGSFTMIDNNTNKLESYSANNSNHLELLRNNIFYNEKNVFIHQPFDHKDIEKYIWNADIGIDFSSSRPFNKKSFAGNAKLLEYCYMGLPVVTEKNVNNSFLVENCSNGILLNDIGTPQQYVDSIKKLLFEIKINRIEASKITIQNENWNVRAKKFIEDLISMKYN